METNSSNIVKMAVALNSILESTANNRSAAFADAHRFIEHWLTNLEIRTDQMPDDVDLEFIRKARIYIRALATYPAHSEEWLEVFWSFQKMFERWARDADGARSDRQPMDVQEAELEKSAWQLSKMSVCER